MSSNANTIKDEDGDYEDWIEIYNGTDSAINLAGYKISDDLNNLTKWTFPEVILQPAEFLLIFASGKDRYEGEYLHTNFSININGEPIILSNLIGEIIDYIPPVKLYPDISYGRNTDGSVYFSKFIKTTPGISNNYGVLYHYLKFSKNGGIYKNAFELSIDCSDTSATIYYTTDGSPPTVNSIIYKYPLQLDSSLYSEVNLYQNQLSPINLHYIPEVIFSKAIVIRAAAFNNEGKQVSKTITNSYFINELGINHYSLPIISISIDKNELLDNYTGIMVPGVYFDPLNPNWSGNYYQRGEEWEREANVEFYEAENLCGFNQQIGLRIHGGNTRRPPQKSFRIYARNKYGKRTIDYNIFNDKNLNEFKRIVIKPFYASWSKAGMEDFVAHKIAKNLNIDNTAIRPAILYLNGEYWGIYYIQERRDKYFTYYNYNANPDNVDIIYNYFGAIQEGSSSNFIELYNFIENNDLSSESNYSLVSEWIDIDNFIDYQLFEIFIANYDWPANNSMFWRENYDNNKWRWIFSDGDAGFSNVEFNGFNHALSTSESYWPTNARSTLFLRKLLKNPNFRNKFFNRLEFLLNNTLYYSNTLIYADSAYQFLYDEVNNQIDRFNFPENDIIWQEKVDNIYNFIKERPCIIAKQTKELFNVFLNLPFCDLYSDKEIEELISLYPNPANDIIYLDFRNTNLKIQKASIYDILGRKIKDVELTSNSFDDYLTIRLDNITQGNYILLINTNQKTISKKFVVIK